MTFEKFKAQVAAMVPSDIVHLCRKVSDDTFLLSLLDRKISPTQHLAVKFDVSETGYLNRISDAVSAYRAGPPK